MTRYDAKREERLLETVLRDAKSPTQQADAWYLHLKAHLRFPFLATVKGTNDAKPFSMGAKLQVIGLARPEHCKTTIHVRVMDGMSSILVSLAHLLPSDTDPNVGVISDWSYWNERHQKG